jgi:hypothetical protein
MQRVKKHLKSVFDEKDKLAISRSKIPDPMSEFDQYDMYEIIEVPASPPKPLLGGKSTSVIPLAPPPPLRKTIKGSYRKYFLLSFYL